MSNVFQEDLIDHRWRLMSYVFQEDLIDLGWRLTKLTILEKLKLIKDFISYICIKYDHKLE